MYEDTKLTTPQKFKVRIEDPPRRRHMVFLGGAVLANLVSSFTTNSTLSRMLIQISRSPTRTTCGYPNRSGRNRAPARWPSSARDKRLYLAARFSFLRFSRTTSALLQAVFTRFFCVVSPLPALSISFHPVVAVSLFPLYCA